MTKNQARYAVSICRACEGSGAIRCVNAQWLRERRVKAKLSLREMARRLGFSAPYISDIERGHRACSPLIETEYAKLEPR